MDPKQVIHEIKFVFPGRIHWLEVGNLKRYALVNNINIPGHAKVDLRYDYSQSVVTVSWSDEPIHKLKNSYDYKNNFY